MERNPFLRMSVDTKIWVLSGFINTAKYVTAQNPRRFTYVVTALGNLWIDNFNAKLPWRRKYDAAQ